MAGDSSWLEVAFVTVATLFIMAILGLSKQETARPGNVYGIVGMAAGVICVYFHVNLTVVDDMNIGHSHCWWLVPVVILIGGAIGVYMAQTVAMVRFGRVEIVFGSLTPCSTDWHAPDGWPA
jgi:H+-translocating NAD(P) transhydrogenase subunit beta